MSRHNANQFRPALEALGARVVPSVDTYLGGPITDFNSWSLHTPPGSTDDAVFDGSRSNASVTIPAGVSLTVGSIQLINSYSGEIDGSGNTSGSLTVVGTTDSTGITTGILVTSGTLIIGGRPPPLWWTSVVGCCPR